jgi:hypothetical protein
MTVLFGILEVITFVNYNVFATKQTGESDGVRHYQHSHQTDRRLRQHSFPGRVHLQQQDTEVQDRAERRRILAVVSINCALQHLVSETDI